VAASPSAQVEVALLLVFLALLALAIVKSLL
jgi:hypothetical protein